MITPSEAVDIRREIVEWSKTYNGRLYVEDWAQRMVEMTNSFVPDLDPNASHSMTLGLHILKSISTAEVFTVTHEMNSLTKHAARSMATQPLRETDVPSRNGLLFLPEALLSWCDCGVFTERVTSCACESASYIHAFSWSVIGDICLVAFHSTSFASKPNTGDDTPMLSSIATWTFGREIGFNPEAPPEGNEMGRIIYPFVLAMWTLMQQTITATTTMQGDRASRRRAERAHVSSAVRVINLRSVSHSAAEGGSREYHHRWIVRGHWRNQWLPSVQEHRLQWISPHMKGPDDAPLLTGEKVYTWTR